MACRPLPEAKKAVTSTTRPEDHNIDYCRLKSNFKEFTGLFDGFSQA